MLENLPTSVAEIINQKIQRQAIFDIKTVLQYIAQAQIQNLKDKQNHT